MKIPVGSQLPDSKHPMINLHVSTIITRSHNAPRPHLERKFCKHTSHRNAHLGQVPKTLCVWKPKHMEHCKLSAIKGV